MLILRVVVFLFWGIFPLLASALDKPDQVWEQDALHRQLLSNLVINGDLSHRVLPGQEQELPGVLEVVAPCWDLTRRAGEGISHGGLGIDIHPNVLPAAITVRPVRHYFEGDEGELSIRLNGHFSEDASLRFGLIRCNVSCSLQQIALTRSKSGYVGVIPALERSEYILRFTLEMNYGVERLESLHVTSSKYPSSAVVTRDTQAVDICYKPPQPLSDGNYVSDLIWLTLSSIVFIALLGTCLMRRLLFPAFLLLAFFVTNVAGIWGLYFGVSEYRLAQGVIERDLITLMSQLNLVVLATASAAYWAVQWLLKVMIRERSAGPCSGSSFWLLTYGLIVLVFWGGQYASILSIASSYWSALTDSGDFLNVAFIRNDIGYVSFGLKSHYFNLIFIQLTVFLALVVLGRFIRDGRWGWGALIFVSQSLLLVYNGEKAPVFWLVYALVFLGFTLRERPVRLSMKNTALGLVLFSVLAMAAVQLEIPVLASILDRMMLGALTVAYYVLSIFPGQLDYLAGASISLLGYAPTGETFDLLFYLWRSIHPELFYSEIRGTAIGAFWTEMYANFGLIGVLFSGVVMGGIVSLVYNLLSERLLPASIAAPFSAWLVFHYSSFVESGLTRFLVDFYLVGLVLCVLMLLFIKRLLKRKRVK